MFKEVDVKCFTCNIFQIMGKEWCAITAGIPESYNTMTAAWGGIGVFVGKNVATAYIRPQRYTKEFVDNNETFTLSFLGASNQKVHSIIGKKSGRDCDKVAEAGLTGMPIAGTMAFEEAEIIMVCKKIYVGDMTEEGFCNSADLERWYPNRDIHTMYIGEITNIFVKE
ncbi:MAG: flavin reductase family protein [Bacillota bacterium]